MEKVILTSAFLMLAAVILMLTGVDKEVRARKTRKTQLKHQREAVIGRKVGRVEKYITAERNLVSATNTNTRTYLMLMVASIAGGFVFGRLVFSDSGVALCIAGTCIVLPHALLLVKGNKDKRERADSLENSMRIITHEYIATQDILRAVENSLGVIENPKPFEDFVLDCKGISSNIERNLRRLESKEHNAFFSKWIDQLILVQHDRTQMVNLMPILDDMNDVKTAQRQNDTKVSAAWRDYFTLLFMILLFPLLIRVVQREWYGYLVTTFVGKALVVIMIACLVWATGRAMKINTPIDG